MWPGEKRVPTDARAFVGDILFSVIPGANPLRRHQQRINEYLNPLENRELILAETFQPIVLLLAIADLLNRQPSEFIPAALTATAVYALAASLNAIPTIAARHRAQRAHKTRGTQDNPGPFAI